MEKESSLVTVVDLLPRTLLPSYLHASTRVLSIVLLYEGTYSYDVQYQVGRYSNGNGQKIKHEQASCSLVKRYTTF